MPRTIGPGERGELKIQMYQWSVVLVRTAGHSTTTITPGSSNRQDMRLWTVESGFKSLPRNF
jgi:hypothetical protein